MSLSTELPTLDPANLQAEKQAQLTEAVTTQQDYLHRLATIAAPILTENVALCPKTRPFFGIITRSAGNYHKSLREDVRTLFNLSDDPEISFIIAGSPADQAGLKIGDTIIGENDRPISMIELRKQYKDIDGEIALHIRRGETKQEISLTPQNACDYPIRLKMSESVNGLANGRAITIYRGMMDFVESEDELAFIIGHELAHNILHHIPKSIHNYVFGGLSRQYTRPFESEADYVGAYMTARAGYDVTGIHKMWRRLSRTSLRGIGHAKTHPTTPDRYLRMKAIEAEIAAKKAAREPLLPNLKN